ncbi:MAG: hypothetical protein AAF721_29040 [Myxococcota bacterium]
MGAACESADPRAALSCNRTTSGSTNTNMVQGAARKSWCRGPLVFVVAALATSACDESVGCQPVLTSEAGQLEFHDQAITVGACRRLREPSPLLQGARWCPAVRCSGDVEGCEDDDGEKLPDEAVAACFERTLTGPVVDDAPCVRMTDAGVASWEFTAMPCEAATAGFAAIDDRIEWTVVAADRVEAHLQAPGDAFALRSLVDAAGDPLDAADALAPGDVAHAVADTPVPFAVVLRHPDHDAPVGWNATNWEIDVEVLEGAAPEITYGDLGLLSVTIDAGAEARLSIVPLPDAQLPDPIAVGVVRGVAEADIVSLEVVPAYAPPPDDSDTPHGPVAGARAVARIDDGTPVYGADVRWSVLEGALPLWRDETLPWTPDYTALAERDGAACHATPERSTTYDATVAADLGALHDEVAVRWTEAPPPDEFGGLLSDFFDDPPPRSERCAGPGFPDEDAGCGCTTNDESTPAATGMLLLFVLGGLRRRALSRRRSRR